MSEDIIFKLVVSTLVAIVVLSPVACVMHRDTLITDAIKSGIPPKVAACSIDSSISTSKACKDLKEDSK